MSSPPKVTGPYQGQDPPRERKVSLQPRCDPKEKVNSLARPSVAHLNKTVCKRIACLTRIYRLSVTLDTLAFLSRQSRSHSRKKSFFSQHGGAEGKERGSVSQKKVPLEPTYKMKPDKPFRSSAVSDIIKTTLVRYQPLYRSIEMNHSINR